MTDLDGRFCENCNELRDEKVCPCCGWLTQELGDLCAAAYDTLRDEGTEP